MRVMGFFSNHKILGITSRAFFDIKRLRQGGPHFFLPFQIIFFHRLVIIAFSAWSEADGTHSFEGSISPLADDIVMFISLVA